MITRYGKELRKFRIDHSLTLREMAKGIDVSAAYLSAIESGKKNITDEIFLKIANFMGVKGKRYDELRHSADLSMKELKLPLDDVNEKQRNSAVMFARRLNHLGDEELAELDKILEGFK